MKKNVIQLSVLLTSIFYLTLLASAEDKKATTAQASSAQQKASTAPTQPAQQKAAAAPQQKAAAPAPKAKAAEDVVEPPKPTTFSAKDVWDKQLFEQDDNKVIVIQDRKYNKAKRLELGVDAGMTAATAFYNSYTFGLRAAYYFNEYWGVQWFGNYSLNTSSREKDQLEDYLQKSGFDSTKEFKEPRTFTGVGFLWNPIYGKFAWFRSRIIHFDIYAGAGLSYLQTKSTFNKPAAGGPTRTGSDDNSVGTLENLGIRIYLSKNMAWTTEVRNNIYQAHYEATTSGGGTVPIPAKTVWQNNFQFVTGVSWLFNLGGY